MRQAIAAVIGRLEQQSLEVRIRALVHPGDLDAFWSETKHAMRARIADDIEQIDPPDSSQELTAEQIGILGRVELRHVRTALPSLEPKSQNLSPWQKASVIKHRPGP
ncbi:hypothetical protein DEF23_20255 [Marinitenerispora sediminis]|nr:hypothetical protein DEF23_20255 [Marinitenerispora sediminis]